MQSSTKWELVLVAALVFFGVVSVTPTASAEERILYRVEAGGASRDSIPRWREDSRRDPSRFLVTTDVTRTRMKRAIDLSHPSVPGGLPNKLFKTGRAAAKNLRWRFPVTPGDYLLRLYFAETSRKIDSGDRVFDVVVEGETMMNDYDVFADVGPDKAVVKSFAVSSDGLLNVNLKSVVGRPNVKALEVLETSSLELEPDPEPDLEPEPVDCDGRDVFPSDDLVAVADSEPAGTTFCIQPGTYEVSSPVKVQDDDHFIGESRNSSFVVTDSARFVFDASKSDEAMIANLDISGATGDRECRPACGRGIWPGTNSTVSSVRLHHNANQGIGGGGDGLLILNAEIYANGGEDFTGCCSAGVKSGNSFTIRNSHVHDNVGSGIWCDVTCPRFVVEDNLVTDNTKNGIRFEHGGKATTAEVAASSALIARNTVRRNNASRNTPGSGIEVNSASNAVVAFNVMGATVDGRGIHVRGSRYPTINNTIVDNRMYGDSISGCSIDGVTCKGND